MYPRRGYIANLTGGGVKQFLRVHESPPGGCINIPAEASLSLNPLHPPPVNRKAPT